MKVFNWFSINYIKANLDKSQLLLTSKDSSPKILLGILIDNKLTINDHVSKLCEKAIQIKSKQVKMHTLVSNYE